MPKRRQPRNLHACHPIMRKGGVHEKSKGAKRAAAKRDTQQKASEWLGRSLITHLARIIGMSEEAQLLCFA